MAEVYLSILLVSQRGALRCRRLTHLDDDFARSWIGDGDIPDFGVSLARYDDGLHDGLLSAIESEWKGGEARVPHNAVRKLANPRTWLDDLTMSEHPMPAPIASTATSAQACTDCLPAPSTSASASTSAAPSSTVAQQAALLDAATFEPPALGSSDGEAPRAIIEFCDRCRCAQLVLWVPRATLG